MFFFFLTEISVFLANEIIGNIILLLQTTRKSNKYMKQMFTNIGQQGLQKEELLEI